MISSEIERTATSSFIACVERERYKRGLTQTEMAQLLNVSKSTYTKLVAGDTGKVSLQLVLRMHQLTNMMVWEMCSQKEPDVSAYYSMYRLLPLEKQEVIKSLIRIMHADEVQKGKNEV